MCALSIRQMRGYFVRASSKLSRLKIEAVIYRIAVAIGGNVGVDKCRIVFETHDAFEGDAEFSCAGQRKSRRADRNCADRVRFFGGRVGFNDVCVAVSRARAEFRIDYSKRGERAETFGISACSGGARVDGVACVENADVGNCQALIGGAARADNVRNRDGRDYADDENDTQKLDQRKSLLVFHLRN